jgi:hypothetical protein
MSRDNIIGDAFNNKKHDQEKEKECGGEKNMGVPIGSSLFLRQITQRKVWVTFF